MRLRTAQRLEVLADREFRLLFCGQAVSLIGDGMVNVALAFAVIDLTGSASDIGLLLASRTLPQFGLLLVGGVAADRYRRARIMLSPTPRAWPVTARSRPSW
jgi:MFS family permease